MLINCVKEVAAFLTSGSEEERTSKAVKVLDDVRQDMKLNNVNKFQEGKYIPEILQAAREKLNQQPYNLRLPIPLPSTYSYKFLTLKN